MSNFIFYDIETTGINIVYDQILQFGAILTDKNLVELDRFEIRCRRLPWIVPSPSALNVTATNVDRLDDPNLPDFFTMMSRISVRLATWGSATFLGYNSMSFDEPLLQRALWQALLPPYVTVTDRNARLDLLPLLRVSTLLRPDLLAVPRRADGAPSYRLDAMAPANGLNLHNAHDAMGDVEATLYLARKLKVGFPELWSRLSSRAPKAALAELLACGKPIYLFQQNANPQLACYFPVDRPAKSHSHATLAQLSFGWTDEISRSKISHEPMHWSLRRISLNKAPVVLTLEEAEAIAGLVPTDQELRQAAFLKENLAARNQIAEMIAPYSASSSVKGAQVEETIFDGFANYSDSELMAKFHRAEPVGQLEVARAFTDPRFRRLAMRILYVKAPEILSPRETAQIEAAISRRLRGEPEGQPWRSLNDALAELESRFDEMPVKVARGISDWLKKRLSEIA